MREQATIVGDGPHGGRAARQVAGSLWRAMHTAVGLGQGVASHDGDGTPKAMGCPATAAESDGRRKATPRNPRNHAVSFQTIGRDSVSIIREDPHVYTVLLSFYTRLPLSRP